MENTMSIKLIHTKPGYYCQGNEIINGEITGIYQLYGTEHKFNQDELRQAWKIVQAKLETNPTVDLVIYFDEDYNRLRVNSLTAWNTWVYNLQVNSGDLLFVCVVN